MHKVARIIDYILLNNPSSVIISYFLYSGAIYMP